VTATVTSTRFASSTVTLIVVLLICCSSTTVSVATEIHRCELPDGTFAFQETPCAEAGPAEDEEPEPEPEAPPPGDVADDSDAAYRQAELPQPVSGDRAECEKRTRDAIDAIDNEMRTRPYDGQEAKAYMAELRVLTEQLRACKRL